MLRTKSIKREVSPDDGLRICIMPDEHPEMHLDYKPFTKQWRQLSPPSKLVRDFLRGLSWKSYVTRYIQEVLVNNFEKIIELAELAAKQDVTILCLRDNPDYCHRRLVALTCQMYKPELKVVIE